MIDLYTWSTPNGLKPMILLEELELPYRLHPIDIGKGAQHTPAFDHINPNHKIPALVEDADTDHAIKIFESGAILFHLAEKSGRFLPSSGQARVDVMGWLFFQVGGVGPMFGQLGHFMNAPEKIPYAIDRYRKEVERLYAVLDKRLGEAPYLAGEYSIADIATFPWAAALKRFGIAEETVPNVKRWLDLIEARPAVVRARAKKMTE